MCSTQHSQQRTLFGIHIHTRIYTLHIEWCSLVKNWIAFAIPKKEKLKSKLQFETPICGCGTRCCEVKWNDHRYWENDRNWTKSHKCLVAGKNATAQMHVHTSLLVGEQKMRVEKRRKANAMISMNVCFNTWIYVNCPLNPDQEIDSASNHVNRVDWVRCGARHFPWYSVAGVVTCLQKVWMHTAWLMLVWALKRDETHLQAERIFPCFRY